MPFPQNLQRLKQDLVCYTAAMSTIHTPSNYQEMPLSIVKSMISLATSGFGVVVALAWNEVIKNTVTNFIDPYLGKSSGLISLVIYATVMTFLAVFVTMQLAQLQKKLEQLDEKIKLKKNLPKSLPESSPLNH